MASRQLVATARAKSLIPTAAAALRPLLVLALLFALAGAQGEASPATTPTPTTALTADAPITGIPTTSTISALTTVVSIFYLNVPGEDSGVPYTMFHRDSGSVVGVDDSATTYVVTATLSDQRTKPMHTRTDNMTTNIPTLRRNTISWHLNLTARPSTITQGPSTFLFTGSGYGPNRTLVNRCRLNGTSSATCNLTHVGDGWYTRIKPDFNGTWSTYNYSWTSGDRFGFAPVTITAGVERLPPPTAAASTSSSAGGVPRAAMVGEACWLAVSGALAAAMAFGIFLVI